MRRYLTLLALQLKLSLLLSLQYRLDFVVGAVLSLFWTAIALIPLLVLFSGRKTVAGWKADEALVVVAWFTVLKGVLDGAIRPALQTVVEQVRKGTLDFLLLKPADAQFLVSTARFELPKLVDVASGLAILVIALGRLGHVPSPQAVALTLLLLCGAVLILYSIWILVIALAFILVKVDNLSFLFASVYDAARGPASVYRGALAILFTFVIPLAVMTTFPALAILERLELWRAGLALVGALAFTGIARVVWLRALRRYTSAGG